MVFPYSTFYSNFLYKRLEDLIMVEFDKFKFDGAVFDVPTYYHDLKKEHTDGSFGFII